MKEKLGFFALYILVPITLIGLGLFGIKTGIEDYQIGKTMTGVTEGVISDSRIEESTDSDGDTDYTTYFTLNYTVRENAYTWETSLEGKYYDNDTVKVYYNPDDPTVSSLQTQGQKIRGILFSALMAGVGIFMAVTGFKSKRKENEADQFREAADPVRPSPGGSKWHSIE